MIDKDKLLAPRSDTEHGCPEDDVHIPGVGTVRVRGLLRGEVLAIRQRAGEDIAIFERKMLAAGMLEPRLSETEAGRWQESSPAGEIEPVTNKISELSGLVEGADKSGVQAAGDEPGSGVRDVPGGEAVDDGGGAADAGE